MVLGGTAIGGRLRAGELLHCNMCRERQEKSRAKRKKRGGHALGVACPPQCALGSTGARGDEEPRNQRTVSLAEGGEETSTPGCSGSRGGERGGSMGGDEMPVLRYPSRMNSTEHL